MWALPSARPGEPMTRSPVADALARVALLTLIIVFAAPARADLASSQRWFNALSLGDRVGIQMNLMLAPGGYDALIDGVFGPVTYNAILFIQKTQGMAAPDGILTRAQQTALADTASRVIRDYKVSTARDPVTGLGLPIPLAFTPIRQREELGTGWYARDGSIAIHSMAFTSRSGLGELMQRFAAPKNGWKIAYSKLGPDYFILSAARGGDRAYMRINRDGERYVGFFSSWRQEHDDVGRRVSAFISSTLKVRTGPPDDKSAEPEEVYSGTGFFVAPSGLLVTNAHVVEGCREVEVVGHGKADVVAFDAKLDLAAAILTAPKGPLPFATIETKKPALGQSLVAVGFPLADLLGANIQVNAGIVSGESGRTADAGRFTTNASLEPGNSGGPILDLHGHVIGVAVERFNAVKLLEAADTVAANIAFAISNETLLQFLRPFTKTTVEEAATTPEKRLEDAVAPAKGFTVLLLCRPPATTAARR